MSIELLEEGISLSLLTQSGVLAQGGGVAAKVAASTVAASGWMATPTTVALATGVGIGLLSGVAVATAALLLVSYLHNKAEEEGEQRLEAAGSLL